MSKFVYLGEKGKLSKQTDKPVGPTLMIGVGGSGKEVLLRFRRLVVERFGSLDALPCLRFIHMDTDQTASAIQQYDLDSGNDPLFGKVKFQVSEKVELKIDGGTGSYIKNMRAYPQIKSWFPTNGNMAELGDLGEGAGAVRLASRLGFFHSRNFQNLQTALKRAKTELTDPEIQRRVSEYGFTFDAEEMEIIIVASLAGGTGSGVFLDTAALVKSMFPDAERVGILFLPTLFSAYPVYPRMQANGYAALMELNHYSFGHRFPANWDNINPDEIMPPPFTYTYLIDGKNDAGFSIGSKGKEFSLYQMAAENVFQTFWSGSFAGRKRATRVNLVSFNLSTYAHNFWEATEVSIKTTDGAKNTINGDTYPNRFGSFGIGTISYPTDKIHSACGCRLASRIIEFWENKACEDPLDTLVTRFLNNTDIKIMQGKYNQKGGGGIIEESHIESELLWHDKDSGKSFMDYLWGITQEVDLKIKQSNFGYKAAVLDEHLNEFNQLMGKEDSADKEEWGVHTRTIESNMMQYSKSIQEGLTKHAQEFADNSQYGIAFTLSVLGELKHILKKGGKEDIFLYKQYFAEQVPLWVEQIQYYYGQVKQLHLDLTHHERQWLHRKDDVNRDLRLLIGNRENPGALYNYLYARIMKQVAQRGRIICDDIDRFLGKNDPTGDGVLGRYHRLMGGLERVKHKLKENENYFSLEKKYEFINSLYNDGDVDIWYKKWIGEGDKATQSIEKAGNQLLKDIFKSDTVSGALHHIQSVHEEDICDQMILTCKHYFQIHDIQPSALELLMGDSRLDKKMQRDIIKHAYDMSKVWLEEAHSGIGHINYARPGSEQKPFYIGVDDSSPSRLREFELMVKDIQKPDDPQFQIVPIGKPNKSTIVFYNELAGVPAFFPDSVACVGGMKEAYIKHYNNPTGIEELHTDKNRFKFSDIVPKKKTEIFHYGEAVKAFVLARILGLFKVDVIDPASTNPENHFSYEKPSRFDHDIWGLGDESHAIDHLYRDDARRETIIEHIESIVEKLKAKQLLAHYLLLLEFYTRNVYTKGIEDKHIKVTKYSPQHALLKFEQNLVGEKWVVDDKERIQLTNSLESLRGKSKNETMTYYEYIDVLKPFTKGSGKFSILEKTSIGKIKPVYYDAFALNIEKLLPQPPKSKPGPKKKDNRSANKPEINKGPESAKRNCPVCKEKINVRANYCSHCKQQVSEHIECPFCGESRVPNDLKACWKCGRIIQEDEKVECPRCYEYTGPRSEYPCHICGYNFEDQQEDEANTSTSKGHDKGDYTENQDEYEEAQEVGEDAFDNVNNDESELIECPSCYEMVKKGPRCPICKVPLNF